MLALLSLVTACGSAKHESPIRVTLTAKNHHPRLTLTGLNHQPPPNQQWGYCVKIRTAAGKPVPAPVRLELRIVSGRTPVGEAGTVTFGKGARDNWCASIGGEYNAFEAVPPGKPLAFQAVVKALGVTVRQNWPIVVHVVR